MVEKIIYTNGILTNDAEATETAALIQELTGIDTEAFHNGSTPFAKLSEMGKNILVGAYKIGISLFGSSKEGLREEGLKSLSKAASLWVKIQKEKSKHAQELAGRVEIYLKENADSRILLIFHSQGAHIGLKALKKLKDYKDRIEVLTIGGLVNIPEHMASRVINLSFSNDPVSWIARIISGSSKSMVISEAWAHLASDYLDHHRTKEILRPLKITA